MSPALTLEATEIDALVVRAREGDRRARDRVVALFQVYVHFVLRRVVKGKISKETRQDLEQEAQLGLLRAIELYDPKRARFSSYCFLWIRAFILGWFRRERRIPCGEDVREGAHDPRETRPADEAVLNRLALRKAIAEEKNARNRLIIESQLAGETLASISKRLHISRERVRVLADGTQERLARRLKDTRPRKR